MCVRARACVCAEGVREGDFWTCPHGQHVSLLENLIFGQGTTLQPLLSFTNDSALVPEQMGNRLILCFWFVFFTLLVDSIFVILVTVFVSVLQLWPQDINPEVSYPDVDQKDAQPRHVFRK